MSAKCFRRRLFGTLCDVVRPVRFLWYALPVDDLDIVADLRTAVGVHGVFDHPLVVEDEQARGDEVRRDMLLFPLELHRAGNGVAVQLPNWP